MTESGNRDPTTEFREVEFIECQYYMERQIIAYETGVAKKKASTHWERIPLANSVAEKLTIEGELNKAGSKRRHGPLDGRSRLAE